MKINGTPITAQHPFSSLHTVHRHTPHEVTGDTLVAAVRLQVEGQYGLEGYPLTTLMGKIALTDAQLGIIFQLANESLQQFPIGDQPEKGTHHTLLPAIHTMEHALYYLQQSSPQAIKEAKLIDATAVCDTYAANMLRLSSDVECAQADTIAKNYWEMARALKRIVVILERAAIGEPFQEFLIAQPARD